MSIIHRYKLSVTWTGNKGSGTSAYKAYERSHEIKSSIKPVIPASSDPSFNGDKSRYNPEELLLASLSSCHMLWYLHLCAVNGVVVMSYSDNPEGEMEEFPDGSGVFKEVILRPVIEVTSESMIPTAEALHTSAHEKCFISKSVNFPVKTESRIEIKS